MEVSLSLKLKFNKMKNLFLAAVFAIASLSMSAQTTEPSRSTQLNFGVGLSGWGIPVYAGLDFGVSKNITLGGEVSYRAYREKYHDFYYDHSIIGFSVNGNYHFNSILNIPPRWDFYAGLNLGFYVWSSPNDYYGDHTSGLGIGGQIGGRYFFTERFGINLEFGGGNAFSGGKFGLTFKL